MKSQNICFCNVSQVLRAVLNIQPDSSNKMSFHANSTPHLGTLLLQEKYNNNKTKSENTIIL